MKVAIYARVSTKDKGQDTENQLIQLREYSKRMDWEVSYEYAEEVSGSGKVARPKFDEMMLGAYQKKFDLVLFWSLDRLTREGVYKTLEYLQKLVGYQVKWKSYTEPFLDTTGPAGELIVMLLAWIAKQERLRLSERVKAGMARAKLVGTKSGVHIGGHNKIFRRDIAKELWAEGKSVREIARELGQAPATIHRAVKGVSRSHPLTLPLECLEMSISGA